MAVRSWTALRHGGFPGAFQALPAVFLAIGLAFSPESPRWLARNDRWRECHNVLALVHARDDHSSPLVLAELQEIRDVVEIESQNADVTYLELFKPRMLNRTHIGIFTQIWSQLTG